MGSARILAHIGPLGHHDLWVVIPMALLGVLVVIVMVRPRRPPAETAEEDQDGQARDR